MYDDDFRFLHVSCRHLRIGFIKLFILLQQKNDELTLFVDSYLETGLLELELV